MSDSAYVARVGIIPTIPYCCSFATLIGLYIRTKLELDLALIKFKLNHYLVEGSHQTDAEITK
jgi:hypothetical protein